MKALVRPYKVERFIDDAGIGGRIHYHEGYLPTDREKDPDVDKIASRTLEAFEDGILHLFQKRQGEYHYSYFAMKKALRAQRIT